MHVEPEAPHHFASIRQLHLAAFPSAAEADLVDQLRLDDSVIISLVAVEQDRVIGHVLFSRMTAPLPAFGMGPVAVIEARRRQGVAAALIGQGIERARAAGGEAVFVLGDPAYYGRFGFRAEDAVGFASPYAGPYFMALSLTPDGLRVREGRVDYAPAFSAL